MFRFSNAASVWLSAADIGQQAGQFRWGDGTPVDKSMWYYREWSLVGPSGETAVYLAAGYNKLLYYTAAFPKGIMCQVPTELSSCLS